jgi:hypothetical protein
LLAKRSGGAASDVCDLGFSTIEGRIIQPICGQSRTTYRRETEKLPPLPKTLHFTIVALAINELANTLHPAPRFENQK